MKTLQCVRISAITIVFVLYINVFWIFSQDNDYHIQPVPFTSIQVTDSFWMPKIKTIRDVTLPHALKMSENRIANFRRAAKLESGGFASEYPFDDSDIYKIIEAASYSLYYYPDSKLEATIDSLITIIGLAQEADGYLYTCRTMNSFPNNWSGTKRWEKDYDLSHETYNLGHLFESACAYYQATGKDKYLGIAIKAADLLDKDFGWDITTSYPQYPGHQIVEVGLARLYRITGDEKYLDLAKFFLDVRGPNGEEYCQAHEKVIDQDKAVGHAVRAVYMYAGMADIAALKNEPSYINAIDNIWNDIVTTKMYVTGGIGASGGNEGFNGAYNLPNTSAYCETCASVGNIYLNHRLFMLHGDAKYIDVLERTLYNALLSGISISGDRFFYPNRLQSSGNTTRSEWFGCACCPPNIARLIPSVPGYIYAHTADTLYVNLFISDSASFAFNGNNLDIVQTSNYPWSGNVEITLNPESEKDFTLMVRIPGWAGNEAIPGDLYSFKDEITDSITLSVNGEFLKTIRTKGYAVIKRNWKAGDKINLKFPMEPRIIIANDNIADDLERVSIQQGPLVYCAEGIDNGGKVLSRLYNKDSLDLSSSHVSGLLGDIEVVKTKSIKRDGTIDRDIILIPYHLWSNRGASDMQVWLSVKQPVEVPDSLILLSESDGDSAITNYISTWEDLPAVYDLYEPTSSGDKGPGAFGNWDQQGATVDKWNWVRYRFDADYKIGSSEVYWWIDGQGINLPDSSYISYFNKKSGTWQKIPSSAGSQSNGFIKKNMYNKLIFTPVITNQIQMNFKSNKNAQGMLEWKVYTTNRDITGLKSLNINDIMVYPNPATENIYISSDSFSDKINVVIYNIQGKLVYENSFNGNLEINKSELGNEGFYLLHLKSNNHYIINKLILK